MPPGAPAECPPYPVTTAKGHVNWSAALLKAACHLPPGLIDRLLGGLSGSRTVRRLLQRRDARRLEAVGEPHRILLVSDVNLGDSINIQPVAQLLRDRLPAARIDYVHSRVAAPLIRSNPHITESVPLFGGRFTPSEHEVRSLSRRIGRVRYDVVFSFCPFLSARRLQRPGCAVIGPLPFALRVVHLAAREPSAVAHLVPNMTGYVGELLGAGPAGAGPPPEGATIYLPADAVERRDRWLAARGLPPDSRPVFLNPDASNRYTLVPEEMQAALLRRLLGDGGSERVLLGSGFTFPGVERRVLERLPAPLARRVTAVPTSLPIDVYAALTDACSVFITADTGPMHIAAARKVCPQQAGLFWNRTSVVGLFGPTLPRVYGYDSSRPGHVPASQDAPSRLYEAACPRKGLLCSVQRMGQTCSGEACFRGLDVEEVAQFALGRVTHEHPRETERVTTEQRP